MWFSGSVCPKTCLTRSILSEAGIRIKPSDWVYRCMKQGTGISVSFSSPDMRVQIKPDHSRSQLAISYQLFHL